MAWFPRLSWKLGDNQRLTISPFLPHTENDRKTTVDRSNSRVPFSRELLPVTRLANGVNSSSNPDRGGNPQLEPERLLSIELGVEHFLDQRAGTIGFSLFHRQIDNYTLRCRAPVGSWICMPCTSSTGRLRCVSQPRT